MFLCAVSNNNRNQTDSQDVASVFTTNLEQPMKLKDFTIELVDVSITANNLITISTANNKFVFRMGTEAVSEQYLGTITPGRYSPAELTELLRKELTKLTPIRGWDLPHKYFTVQFSSNKFIVKFDSDDDPAKMTTKLNTTMIQENVSDFGYQFNIVPAGTNEKSTMTTEFKTSNIDDLDFNNQPLTTQIPNNPFQGTPKQNDSRYADFTSATGLDVGDDFVSNITVAGFDETGIVEDGGVYETIFKPMRCVKQSAYCSPSTSDNVNGHYFIITNNTLGSVYDNNTFVESLLNPASGTVLEKDNLGEEYVSGIFLHQETTDTGDERGLPYNLPDATLIFPTNHNAFFDGAGDLVAQTNRVEQIASTWNSSFRMRKFVGQRDINFNSYNFFRDRGFNLVLNGTNNPNNLARSSFCLTGFLEEKEPITIRLADRPLIAGLFQGDSGGTRTQTKIVKTAAGGPQAILTTKAAVDGNFKFEYIVGSVGRYNTEYCDLTAISDQTCINGRFPTYKITKLDADGKAEIVVTCDAGEGVETAATLSNPALYLSDPNTFRIIRTTDNVDVTNILSLADRLVLINTCCDFITPTADSVGVATELFTTKFQYLNSSVSLVNDLIYSTSTSTELNNIIGRNSMQDKIHNAHILTDLQLNIIPRDSENASKNNTIGFEVEGFIPATTDFATEKRLIEQLQEQPNLRAGVEIFFPEELEPGSWSGDVTYSSGTRTLTDWTLFDQNTATSRIRLRLKIKNYYEFEASVAYSTDSGATFIEDCSLINTFEIATVNGLDETKLDCTAKSRLYPYHPCISIYPGTGFSNAEQGVNSVTLQNTNAVEYPPKLYNDVLLSNYFYKIANIPIGSVNTPSIFVFPADQAAIGGADLAYAPIMIKFGSNLTVNAAPTLADNGKLPAGDIKPEDLQMISKATDLKDSYFAVSSDYVGGATLKVLTLEGGTDPNFTPKINTFAVEMSNFPAKGFITFGYNRDGSRVGTGNSSQIVGVVPFLKEKEITSTSETEYQTLQYSTPYSQPVTIELPSETFVYNFDFRLRDIATGQYVKGLLNPTSLIFRVQPLISN